MRLLLAFLPTVLGSAHAQDAPQLVLQITVDQLHGDLPTRYYDPLGEGGFRYLRENGVAYRNAHHAHANTETIASRKPTSRDSAATSRTHSATARAAISRPGSL